MFSMLLYFGAALGMFVFGYFVGNFCGYQAGSLDAFTRVLRIIRNTQKGFPMNSSVSNMILSNIADGVADEIEDDEWAMRP